VSTAALAAVWAQSRASTRVGGAASGACVSTDGACVSTGGACVSTGGRISGICTDGSATRCAVTNTSMAGARCPSLASAVRDWDRCERCEQGAPPFNRANGPPTNRRTGASTRPSTRGCRFLHATRPAHHPR
jgi:hypothetical protein